MDVRDRVGLLARALCHPDGVDLDDWFAPGARLDLPAVGLERDLRDVLAGARADGVAVLPLADCTIEVVRFVRNVVFVNWDAVLANGRGGRSGNAVLSLDRTGLVTHVRLEGALLPA